MSRKEAEAKITEHILEIAKIVREYCPEDGGITIFIMDGRFSAWNRAFYDNAFEKVLDFFGGIPEEAGD